MAKVVFKRGTAEELAKCAITDGQVLIVTDTGALYFDVDSKRVRVGDFIGIATKAELDALVEEGADENALYYVKEEGKAGLYIKGSDSFVSLTGATSVEAIAGSEETGIKATYDAESHKITITFDKKNLVDEETIQGIIQSDTTVQSLKTTVDTLNGAATIDGSVKKQIADSEKKLIGADSEYSSDNTIGGAKKYADEKIAAAISTVYKPAGSKTGDDITGDAATTLLVEKSLGNVYNISTEFTTTENFVEDSGKKYPAGTNVVVVKKDQEESVYQFDVLTGIVDLTGYAKSTEIEAAKTELKGQSTQEVITDSIGAAADDILTKVDAKIKGGSLEWGAFADA